MPNAIAAADGYTREAAVPYPWSGRDVGKRLSRLYEELNRRRVFRTIIAYVVLVWLLSQGAADLFPAFGLSDGAVRIFVIGALAMIPVVGLLSWHFDITSKGVKPDRYSDPGMLADEDLTPDNAGEWARNRHEPQNAGYLWIVWDGLGGDTLQRLCYDPVVIGRDPGCDLQIPDPRVSRVHAVLYAEKGHWLVRDIDSSNGTFVDGDRVEKGGLTNMCRVRFHREGPELQVEVRNVPRTELTRAAETDSRLTRTDAETSGVAARQSSASGDE
jgi:hypothetical protein